MLPIFKK